MVVADTTNYGSAGSIEGRRDSEASVVGVADWRNYCCPVILELRCKDDAAAALQEGRGEWYVVIRTVNSGGGGEAGTVM